MIKPITKNTLFYGDNLPILREYVSDESVDLIYLDPPFKSGHVKSGDIRDLRGVLDRESSAIGVFITLEEPSKDMSTESVSSGYYHSNLWDADYPRIQILTIEDLLNGKTIDMPKSVPNQTFKQAGKVKKKDATQDGLF